MSKNFDFDSLTLGEVALIEELSGQSIGSIADEGAPKGKAMAAIVMVIKRRTGEPDYQFNQALMVPLSEANALLTPAEEEEDPSIPANETEAGKERRSGKNATA